jgi:penicillin-insensitive murein endopeptidase
MGVSRALRERAAEVMMQPRRAAHDDHFHIRIACPRAQQGTCVEEAVVYAPRPRPPVSRSRHRSGTDDRSKPLPALPASPKSMGAVAGFTDPVKELDPADTMETASRADQGTVGAPRPLANASEADNVER